MGFWDIVPPYRTTRFLEVKSNRLAMINFSIQALILGYIIGYQIVVKKGYQEFDSVIGTTSVKVKGSASNTNFSQVFDSYELIQPPLEADALFVTTAFLETLNQTKRTCSGAAADETCAIYADGVTDTCSIGTFTTNGIVSGPCVSAGVSTAPPYPQPFSQGALPFPFDPKQPLSAQNYSNLGYCTVQAWCPIENDNAPITNLVNVNAWTVFPKVNVEFPLFGIAKSNADTPSLQFGYNLFTIEMMTDATGSNFTEFASTGGVILATLQFQCNFDIDSCVKTWQFSRIDGGSSLSPGFNYRYGVVSTGLTSGRVSRALYKAYGVRIVFHIFGLGGRFSVVPLLLALGSGIGLLSLSSLVTDFVLMRFMPESPIFAKHKVFIALLSLPSFIFPRSFHQVETVFEGSYPEPQIDDMNSLHERQVQQRFDSRVLEEASQAP